MAGMKKNDFKDLEIFLGEEKGVINMQKEYLKKSKEGRCPFGCPCHNYDRSHLTHADLFVLHS
jgi:hypothetical protein